MNQIKFSKEYPKLWGQTTAILLAIKFIEPKDFPLNQDLLDYDTKAIDGSYYPLPKTKYLQLIFLGNKKIPFCTIRRYTPPKWGYYHLLVGQDFELIREFTTELSELEKQHLDKPPKCLSCKKPMKPQYNSKLKRISGFIWSCDCMPADMQLLLA